MRDRSSRSYRGLLLTLALLLSFLGQMINVPGGIASATQPERPSIQVTKKRCDGRDVFPVFVESHCVDVPDASFELKDPQSIHAETLSSGERYTPDDWHFGGSNLWSLNDLSSDASVQGVRVVSCLESQPGSNWNSSVPRVVHPDGPGGVLIDWMFVPTAVPEPNYQPSMDCVWLELTDLYEVPAVLSLQVFTTEAPYLNWTEITRPRLQDLPRGESGEDLEAQMVMTNTTTGEVYSFAADGYGQVLVPPATYSLVETTNGLEEFFSMPPADTTLVEIGLAAPASSQSAAPPADTGTFSAGVLYCDASTCSPVFGATIYYQSLDGSLSGYCVTEVLQTPNGYGAWCDYPFIEGMPMILTLDESTLPPGVILTSENPQTYLVPEHPDGPLGPVFFQVGPA